jgi:hypothetical protein
LIVITYIDQSGTHFGAPVMLLGGRIAQLGQEGLEYFHGVEFRNQRGQFNNWSPPKGGRSISEANKIGAKHTLTASPSR